MAYEKLFDARHQRADPDTICIFGNGGGGCTSLLYAQAQGELGSGATGAVAGSRWSYLVPDGVASITAHYARQGHKQG